MPRWLVVAAANWASVACASVGGSGVGDPEYYEVAYEVAQPINLADDDAWLTTWLPALAGACGIMSACVIFSRLRAPVPSARPNPLHGFADLL